MKKIILLAGLVAGGVALSVTAYANNWLLYLPAILAGSGGGTEPPPPPPETTNNWLLYLPAILAGSQGGTAPPPVVTGELNDTGITTCAGSIRKEDCDYGRDVTVPDPDPSDGHAGFEFTVVTGGCIKDEVTGLVWSLDQGAGVWSETSGMVDTANTGEGLCGSTSWRMPTIKELVSIVAYHTHSPAIDNAFFTGASSDTGYWSDTVVHGATSRWTVSIFGATVPVLESNSTPLRVRLVHD